MSSARSMLNDLLFKSKRLENEIQKLERRLKKVEREENPLGVFEPDIDMLISGAIVNCKFRNMIDENEPGRVFQNDGRAEFSTVGNRKYCLLKFERPVPNVKGMSIKFLKNPIMNFKITDPGAAEEAAMRVQAFLTNANWNPSDVTWNSYTASAGVGPGIVSSYAVGFEFDDELTNKTEDDLDGNIFTSNDEQFVLSGIPFGQHDIGPIRGIEVKLDHRAPARPVNLQSTGEFNGQLEVGIKDPIDLDSSFIMTI